MLDVPQNINVTHKIDAKDVSIKLSLYDAEKNTLCGIPVPGLIAAGVALVAAVYILRRKGKNK